MPAKFATVDTERPMIRPTLPSIHTLDLLPAGRPTLKREHHDNEPYAPMGSSRVKYHHDRQVSTSSSNTSTSRNSSPAPYDANSRSPTTQTTTQPSPVTKFRLVPCPFETADAILYIPPPGTSSAPQLPNYAPRSGKGQGILILGHNLQQFRSDRRPLAKGARIHPYRVVLPDNTPRQRRSSVISVTSFSPTV